MDEAVAKYAEHIQKLSDSGGLNFIFGEIAMSLFRIALAQEEVAALAKMDLESVISEEVENRASQKATEMVEESNKRSFIGKR